MKYAARWGHPDANIHVSELNNHLAARSRAVIGIIRLAHL